MKTSLPRRPDLRGDSALDKMKQWHRLGQLLCSLCVCCLLLLSCTLLPAPDSPNTGTGRITIGTTLKVRTLDPADAYEHGSGLWINNLGDRLYSYSTGTAELKPQLATALPKISKDGLTHTIPLRTGVLFHDGTPFNAEAMAFSLRRFVGNKGNPSQLLAETVESVRATGEYELTIQLKKPFAAFPALLTFFGTCAISPKAYEIGAGKFKPDTFTGTGPYKLAKYGPDSLKLDVFDNYWGEKPANGGVDVQIFSSAANLYSAFRAGAVDIAYQDLDPEQISSLEQMAPAQGWGAIAATGNYASYWVLNTSKPPLNSPDVRRALAAFTDRPLLVERVLKKQAEPLYSQIPTTFDVSVPAFKQRYGDGDAGIAKQLLRKAGYTKDSPLKIEIWHASDAPVRGLVASTLKALAQQRLDGALQLEIRSVESTTAFDNLEKGIYQTFLLGWYADFFDADNYVQPFLDCFKGSPKDGCKSGSSQMMGSFYYSERANELIDRERKEQDSRARKAIFGQIQELSVEDVPYIPLWQNIDYAFAQKGVTGVRVDATQQLPLWAIRKSTSKSAPPPTPSR